MGFFRNESLLVLPKFNSGLTFNILKKELDWKQNQLKLYGKIHNEPRLTAWFGPKYSYSSIIWNPSCFPKFLQIALYKVSHAADFNFNAALVNYYRDGSDSMGWHSDDEKEIDQSCIASLSFGEERRFLLRNKNEVKMKKEYLLKDNDLILMNNLQKNWQHSIPKTTRPLSGRINITFRRITG